VFTTINLESNVAVYVQIENSVRFAIASGELKHGDQLPSVRELSERLNVTPNTVAKAYRDLEVMGYLYTRRGMGVFIQRGVEAKCQREVREGVIRKLHEVCAEAKAAGMTNKDINDIVGQCLKSESGPYESTPDSILKLAKSSGKKASS